MTIYINYNIKKDGRIESISEGCGCCSSNGYPSKKEALEEIDDAIKELNELREKILKIEDKSTEALKRFSEVIGS
jgi:hypothetical protein